MPNSVFPINWESCNTYLHNSILERFLGIINPLKREYYRRKIFKGREKIKTYRNREWTLLAGVRDHSNHSSRRTRSEWISNSCLVSIGQFEST